MFLYAATFFLCFVRLSSVSHGLDEDAFLSYVGRNDGRQFFQVGLNMYNRDVAEERCASQRMTLAKIRSVEEQEWLKQLLPNKNTYYWTSGKSISHQSMWSDGTTVDIPVSISTPNCIGTSSNGNELVELSCENRYYALCQPL